MVDVFLQILDATRVTVTTGETLNLSNFNIMMTSNIGSAKLMSLQHSGDATRERYALACAQQAFRPEISVRITERLGFHRLGYEHQLEIAEKFLAREVSFLRSCGHDLTVDSGVLPFLVRKGFHLKLGARPMRDAVEKLVGDAVAECLLAARQASGVLADDEARDCLVVR